MSRGAARPSSPPAPAAASFRRLRAGHGHVPGGSEPVLTAGADRWRLPVLAAYTSFRRRLRRPRPRPGGSASVLAAGAGSGACCGRLRRQRPLLYVVALVNVFSATAVPAGGTRVPRAQLVDLSFAATVPAGRFVRQESKTSCREFDISTKDTAATTRIHRGRNTRLV